MLCILKLISPSQNKGEVTLINSRQITLHSDARQHNEVWCELEDSWKPTPASLKDVLFWLHQDPGLVKSNGSQQQQNKTKQTNSGQNNHFLETLEVPGHSEKRGRRAWEMRPGKTTRWHYRFVALFTLLDDGGLMNLETWYMLPCLAFQRLPVQMNLCGVHRMLYSYNSTLVKAQFSNWSI